jgi:hypothetical protein
VKLGPIIAWSNFKQIVKRKEKLQELLHLAQYIDLVKLPNNLSTKPIRHFVSQFAYQFPDFSGRIIG